MKRKVVNVKRINKNTKKKILLKITASLIGLGVIASSSYGIYQYKENKRIKTENKYGYENINPYDYFKVKSDNFVLLDIGDHNTSKIFFQNKKIKMCNEKDISLGIIVSTDSYKESEIYDDVEYVKGIIKNNKIDFPVYLNIDKIIENENLNIEMKTKLIKDFLEKCSSNKIYVGVNGKDVNLCRMKKYCNITEYDAYVELDENQDEPLYDGVCTIIKDKNGKITAKENLATIIGNKKLNSSDNFANDGKHVIKENESIIDIAMKYGMSEREILEFNNKSKKDIVPGVAIRIPCIIDKNIPETNSEYLKLEDPIRGCDISYAQGNNIDWQTVKDNFEYVIVKISQGLNLDSCYENNMKYCGLNNIKTGIYCYNGFPGSLYPDKEEYRRVLEKQADFVLENLKNKKVSYPIYLDIETNQDVRNLYTSDDMKIMLDVWKDKMLNAGYEPGIYCNRDTFEYISNSIDYDINEEFSTWISGGNQYTRETRDIDIEDIKAIDNTYNYKNKNYTCDMLQVTDSATNAGAQNDKGHLDINYSYVDYSKKTTGTALVEPDEIKEFGFRTPSLNKIAIASSEGLSILALGAIFIKKRKNKKMIKGR